MPVTCAVGTKLSLMRRDERRIFRNLAVTMKELTTRTGGRRPVAVFHTDCGARGRMMLDRVAKDEIVADMQRPSSETLAVPGSGCTASGRSPSSGAGTCSTTTRRPSTSSRG